jgi:hypothetical protein
MWLKKSNVEIKVIQCAQTFLAVAVLSARPKTAFSSKNGSEPCVALLFPLPLSVAASALSLRLLAACSVRLPAAINRLVSRPLTK